MQTKTIMLTIMCHKNVWREKERRYQELVEMCGNSNFHNTAGGSVNWYNLEHCLAVFAEAEYITYGPAILFLGIPPIEIYSYFTKIFFTRFVILPLFKITPSSPILGGINSLWGIVIIENYIYIRKTYTVGLHWY